MNNNLDEKLSLEEFQESFWAYIPDTLITNKDLENNRDWADSVVHDAWRMYIYSDVDKLFIFKNAENILFSIKRYSPVFE